LENNFGYPMHIETGILLAALIIIVILVIMIFYFIIKSSYIRKSIYDEINLKLINNNSILETKTNHESELKERIENLNSKNDDLNSRNSELEKNNF
jgi:peptidoglycan hydrolase CwlO-like protein